MSDYPCPDCGREGRGPSAHAHNCPRDKGWRELKREMWSFGFPARPPLVIELEAPTGKGRFK